jgi:hypothetical protein
MLLAPDLLPASGFRYGVQRQGASQWGYRTREVPPAAERLVDASKKLLLEFRSAGKQFVLLPGCSSQNGDLYVFEGCKVAEAEIPVVDGMELRRCALRLAAGSLLLRSYPMDSEARQRVVSSVAGAVARLGMKLEHASAFLESIVTCARDPDVAIRLAAVNDAYALRSEELEATGVVHLGELLGDTSAARLIQKYLRASFDQAPPVKAPTIEVVQEIEPMQTALERYLRERGDIFQRAGGLVRVVQDGRTTRVLGLESPTLHKIASEARWLRTKDEKFERVSPPKPVLDALLAEGSWTLPRLKAVVSCPTITPTGEVIAKNGYHAGAEVFVALSEEFAPISDSVTKEEARKLLDDEVSDLLSDFVFVDERDRVATIGAMLTMVIRSAIEGNVPLFGTSSPVPGSGKGLLIDVVVTPALGMPPKRTPFPGEDEEIRKLLFAAGMGGEAVLMLDNVGRPLRCDAICAYLTSYPEFQGRVLGLSVTRAFPSTMVLFATGVNLRAVGDIARRAVVMELDPEQERPETRTGFKYPSLMRRVVERRRFIVPALISAVKAYFNAGCPDVPHHKGIGSYDEWSQLVRKPLLWLGIGDPGAKIPDRPWNNDPELEAWSMLMENWEVAFGNEPITIKNLMETHDMALKQSIVDIYREARLDSLGILRDAKRITLGKIISGFAGRIIAGRRLERAERGNSGNRWRVVTVASAEGPGNSGGTTPPAKLTGAAESPVSEAAKEEEPSVQGPTDECLF